MGTENHGPTDVDYYVIGRVFCELSLPPCLRSKNDYVSNVELMQRNIIRILVHIKYMLGPRAKYTSFNNVDALLGQIIGCQNIGCLRTIINDMTAAKMNCEATMNRMGEIDENPSCTQGLMNDFSGGFGGKDASITPTTIHSPIMTNEMILVRSAMNRGAEEIEKIGYMILSYHAVIFTLHDLWKEKLSQLTTCGGRMVLTVILKLESEGLIHVSKDYCTYYVDMSTIYYKETRLDHLQNLKKYGMTPSLYLSFGLGKPNLRRKGSRPWIEQMLEYEKKFCVSLDEKNELVIRNIYLLGILQMQETFVRPADALILNFPMVDNVFKKLQKEGLLVAKDTNDEQVKYWKFLKIKTGDDINKKLAPYGIDFSFLNYTYNDLHNTLDI